MRVPPIDMNTNKNVWTIGSVYSPKCNTLPSARLKKFYDMSDKNDYFLALYYAMPEYRLSTSSLYLYIGTAPDICHKIPVHLFSAMSEQNHPLILYVSPAPDRFDLILSL